VRKLAALALPVLLLAACQSGGDSTGTGAIDPLASVAEQPKAPSIETGAVAPVAEQQPRQQVAAAPAKERAMPVQGQLDDRVREAMTRIAGVQESRGNRVALSQVLQCYERAKKREATMDDARVCAAQDFVISKSVLEDSPRERDGTLILLSKRSAQRIGAVLQFKGMGQSQFNNFARYLHSFALPAYRQAKA
jgi:hypothetical protein